MGFPGGSEGKVSACSARDLGLIPGSGRFPGEGTIRKRKQKNQFHLKQHPKKKNLTKEVKDIF